MSDKDKELFKRGGVVIFVGLAVMLFFLVDVVINLRVIV